MNSAKIVIDVGFGDGGKGLVVDNLCSQAILSGSKEPPVVVRFSGGQQCGHTVITPDGIKHVFSSFGSGSLLGCLTFFTEDTTMYLPALMNEHRVLAGKGVKPKQVFHPLAMLTTPYDVAFNRAKEEFISKHGSCGLGVGATMKRCIETPYKTYVMDMKFPSLLIAKMKSVRRYYENLLSHDSRIMDIFDDHVMELLPEFHDSLYAYNSDYFTVDTAPPKPKRDVIFEGSQGVMLDMDHGVFPNVTYANTTSKNAFKYVREWTLKPELFYVTRCYTTRHGEGWMPDESAIDIVNNHEEINVHNRWQGDFRLGEFNYDMVNHAIAADACYHNGLKYPKNLVLTCVDQRHKFQFDGADRIHGIDQFWLNDSPRRGSMKQIPQ
jgi:adenylosuccinate synthase